MNKSNKIYKKALKQYYNGNIEKSLELCEKSISESMENSSVINLKGLLYYFKGELHSAEALWKLNSDINKDLVSKKYLQDLKEDEKRLDIYYAALELIKKLNINEALILLSKCEESDFNCINVNNYIALCYIKKGEYETALKYIDKVLEIDRKNHMALKNKEFITKYGIVNKQFKIKPMIIIISIVLIFITIFFSFNIFNKKSKVETEKEKLEEPQNIKEESKPKEEAFPYKKMQYYIKNKDFNEIYNILECWKDKNLEDNYKLLLLQGENILKDEGIVYFYDNGISSLKSGNNKDSKEWFLKSYNCSNSKENYLHPHITFMLASAYEKDGDIENCLKYYYEYDKLYQDQCYEETVLYKLAILNRNIDKEKSKNYAKKLLNNFPQSDYNNSIINEILK